MEFLEQLRWGDGFSCPRCGCGEAWHTRRGHWMCAECGLKTSATAATIFHRSHSPLSTWFAAIWFVTSQKNGVSAQGLQDACAGTAKAPITIAVERLETGRLGRVRLELAGLPGSMDQIEFAQEVIAPGTEVHTDGASVFRRLTEYGFTHHATPGYLATDLDAVMPGPHLVSSLLKRWTAGTLHHRVSHAHLSSYLDEFTFRFNRRTSRARGLLCYRLLQQATDTDPHPLKELVGGTTTADIEDL